ncbi:MAG: PEP/pyruvate-binding domain-containing protein [Planctomycetota bacterium]
MSITDRILRLFSSQSEPDPAALARLRARMGARFQDYRDLLRSNNRALTLMAELQGGEQQEAPITPAFLRASATGLAVAVRSMIRHLDALAPDRYPELRERFGEILCALDEVVCDERPAPDGPLVTDLALLDRGKVELTGPKMAMLGELRARGLEVPDGFVVTTVAYDRLIAHNQLRPEIDRLLQVRGVERVDELFAACSALQGLFTEAELPPGLEQEMAAAAHALQEAHGPKLRLAVRSSALGEDASHASFAGQFRTLLNVHPRELPDAYREVVASAYSPEALTYYRHHELRDQDLAMAVGCQVMMPGMAGGVAYSSSPVDLADQRVWISACWGLPKGVVDGSGNAEQIAVDLATWQVERWTGGQGCIYQCDPRGGVLATRLPAELVRQSPLSDQLARELAAQARELEDAFGGPQDLEWALTSDDRLVFLQCRPLHCAAKGSAPLSVEALPPPLIVGGLGVSPGAAAGRIHWVRTGQDALAFQKGQVLAVERPLPRWASLLGRAAAVLATEGNLAGHLATVAREYGVPALFDLRVPLYGLPQGTEVTVDADRGAVYPGQVPELLVPRQRPSAPPSRLRLALRRLVELVVPLHLVDPAVPEFKASNCRTLHDITRFCHEQAVQEVFRVEGGKFPQAAAKRLYFDVPMDWQLIDLGGGFHAEVKEKHVRLEEIACRPFLALWQGMTAVEWAGPPVSAGGLASVIMQSSMRPELENRSGWPDGNYFLVGRDFMNLQSRLGMHLASVEALAGQEAEENFVIFAFQGGGADMSRRQARLELMGSVLEGLGFDMTIKMDVGRARAAGVTAERALKMVRALGYLLIHTRQLDMAMTDSRLVVGHRGKMDEDLQALEHSPIP